MPVNFNPANALTNLLYSGEIFDQRIAMQYLRARYYDPSTGTFNRLDPFSGRMRDPQSLHKYLYVHGDPVQGIDPKGLMSLGQTLNTLRIGLNAFAKAHPIVFTGITALSVLAAATVWRRHIFLGSGLDEVKDFAYDIAYDALFAKRSRHIVVTTQSHPQVMQKVRELSTVEVRVEALKAHASELLNPGTDYLSMHYHEPDYTHGGYAGAAGAVGRMVWHGVSGLLPISIEGWLQDHTANYNFDLYTSPNPMDSFLGSYYMKATLMNSSSVGGTLRFEIWNDTHGESGLRNPFHNPRHPPSGVNIFEPSRKLGVVTQSYIWEEDFLW